MKLRSALNDVKRTERDTNTNHFPGERRSTAGLFSGLDERLVHIAPDGSLRDYSYPLCKLTGIEQSRFGLKINGSVRWLEEGKQRYLDETAIVETTYDCNDFTLVQYDLTVGTLHLTHFELRECESSIDQPVVQVYLNFAPEGRIGRTGQLRHEDAIEIYHSREHDYITTSTMFDSSGQVPQYFEDILDADPTEFACTDSDGRYEETQLTPIVTGEVELTGSTPSTTIATLLTDTSSDGYSRVSTLERVRSMAVDHADRQSLIAVGQTQAEQCLLGSGSDTTHDTEGLIDDLRVLSLLRASNGARIAGPEFDPFFRYSGGYGYTWFRDDAEIAISLLTADHRAGLDLGDWHRQSAHFYAKVQLEDGTWPHRVWPFNGKVAPGWAHGRVEEKAVETDYQADQTASVATFLATYLRVVDETDEKVRTTLIKALEGLNATLEDDGLPEKVQNAWENMTGRFTHTAATYLEAYAAISQAPIDDEYRRQAANYARSVYEALDQLWVSTRGCYALRLNDGQLDDRLDGSTFALASAHLTYDMFVATIDDDRIERLISHLKTTIHGLYQDPNGPVSGLSRFEGDPWRRKGQEEPKIWTVTTAWGANAAAEFSELLATRRPSTAEEFANYAQDLLTLIKPGGELQHTGNYLPEQFFNDGTPDSATPLGWPHAVRLATTILLEQSSLLQTRSQRCETTLGR